jgi:thioredoxin-related protein
MKIQLLSVIGLLFLNLIFGTAKIYAQDQSTNTINWQTFDQIKEQKLTKPKPILVYFYKSDDDTSKLMLNTTLANKDICTYINGKYYATKFDLNSTADINFLDGKVYKKDPAKPNHDLTKLLLGDKPIFPTVLIYNNKAMGFSFNGFKNQYDMLCMLLFIGEDVEKTTRYDLWAPAYFRTFPPGKLQNHVPLGIHWLSLDEALKMNKDEPKKIFLTWYTKWNASSSVFLFNTLNHPKNIEYMNQNFYCVRIDAQTTDTLVWDKTFINKNEPHQYHEMAVSMLKGKMQFPSYFFFDSQNKIILNDEFYLSPDAFYVLSNYVGSDSYKTIKLADFAKSFKVDWNTPATKENVAPK